MESADALRALDHFREGDVYGGWGELVLEGPCPLDDFPVVSYHNNPEAFKCRMLILAQDFETEGY